MESGGSEGVAGARSGWRMPRALGVVWVIEEKITALYCVWFSFLTTGESCCSRGCSESDKEISKKRKRS